MLIVHPYKPLWVLSFLKVETSCFLLIGDRNLSVIRAADLEEQFLDGDVIAMAERTFEKQGYDEFEQTQFCLEELAGAKDAVNLLKARLGLLR